MKIYRVRDNKTGLFSTGGYDPNFTESGKSWQTMGQVILHLKLYARGQYGKKKIPNTWEIVEFEIKETKCFDIGKVI